MNEWQIFQEYSVKIKTSNGVINFIPVSNFPFIANEMLTAKYSKNLMSLYTGFINKSPIKDTKIVIDNLKSVIIFENNVIPFIIHNDKINFKSATIQKICGYKKLKLLDNFKAISFKINDCYYLEINSLKEILNSRITKEYKENLGNLFNKLLKFS